MAKWLQIPLHQAIAGSAFELSQLTSRFQLSNSEMFAGDSCELLIVLPHLAARTFDMTAQEVLWKGVLSSPEGASLSRY